MAHPPRTAVILGASLSGLMAARALSGHCERVILVERDALPDNAEPRKGVPQGAHAHGLLASGYRVMERYFPGMMAELEARGAPGGDAVGDFLWFQYGRWKLRYHAGLRGITVSRPFLEAEIRRRVRSIPNVTFLEGAVGEKPAFDAETGRVTGLVVRARDGGPGEAVGAELVLDASGRGSRSPKWLEESGYGRPDETTVRVNLGYATRALERRPGEFFDSIGGIIASTPPAGTRLGAVLAAEGDRWVVTLAGTLEDYPPADEEAWIAFARTLPVPAVHDLVASARPLTDIVTYRFPANRRRHYERLRRHPAGYLVIGDALCSFNPIYGQGMSVAAMEALVLDEALAAGLEGVAGRFYRSAARIVDIPWAIATGEDFRYPGVEGKRPPLFGMMNRYFERVHALASVDRVVCAAFFQVLTLLAAPSSLLAPGLAWRVLSRPVPRGEGSPWGEGPSVAGAIGR